jgi:hypothetical protein
MTDTSKGGPTGQPGVHGKGKHRAKLAALKVKVKVKPTTSVGDAASRPKWNCRACGRQHNCLATGAEGNCPFNMHQHPDRNQTNQTWALSPKGREWKTKDHDMMPLDGQMSKTLAEAEFDMDRKKLKKGETIYTSLHSISANNYARLPCQLLLNHRLGTDYLLPVPRALADTGSSEYSFICPRFVKAISSHASLSNVHVSGALRGQPSIQCLGQIPLPVEPTPCIRSIIIVLRIIDMLPFVHPIIPVEPHDIILSQMADKKIGGSLTMKTVIRRFNDIQIMKEFPNTSFIISKEEVLVNYNRVFDILAEASNEGICVITDACTIDEAELVSYANDRLTTPGEGIV